MSARGCPDCGAIIKVFRGQTVPHECTPICTTPGCRLHRHHTGICAVATPREQGPLMTDARARAEAYLARPCTTPGCGLTLRHEVCVTRMDGGRRVSLTERDLTQGAKRGPYAPGEFTPWPVTMRHGRPVLTAWGILKASATSPLGVLYGLALLVLLWLSGCA